MRITRFSLLLPWLLGRYAVGSSGEPSPIVKDESPFAAALERYQEALDHVDRKPVTLLATLLARDAVAAARSQVEPLSMEEIQQLVALDDCLRKQASGLSLDLLPDWRQTLAPDKNAWWWFLSQQTEDSLGAALEQYEASLDVLSELPQTLLAVLHARDRVEAARKLVQSPSPEQDRNLVMQDDRLRQRAANLSLASLPAWRQVHAPPSDAWWWDLDQEVKNSLGAALDDYEQCVDALGKDPLTLLAALQARDRVEVSRGTAGTISSEQNRRVVVLDSRLREQAANRPLDQLGDWRQTLSAPEPWWWRLDEEVETREVSKDLPWILLTGTLMAMAATLTADIIGRLWNGAPDSVSVFGTLVTFVLTGSPLVKQGQELGNWLVKDLLRLKLRFRGEARAAMAAVAFLLVLGIRLSLPQLAIWYNNRGYTALQVGNLTTAQQYFQRAVALNPDLVVPYQNLADVYLQIGQPEEALIWYQKAIEHDRGFGPAYRGLGNLYNEQGQFERAEQVLLAGLALEYALEDMDLRLVTQYELLSNLGWSYFEQDKIDRAQEALEAAVAMEEELRALGGSRGVEYRLALPHYYLAQVYEELGQTEDAIQQWEESLRFIDPEDWAHREWLATVRSHLEQLRENQP